MKGKINQVPMNSKNKNIIYLYGEIRNLGRVTRLEITC
jgi:hypothetical protein